MTTSQKCATFISEPMGTKAVEKLPGIGPALGIRLRQRNLNFASVIYVQFLSLGDAFEPWLGLVCSANKKQSRDCYDGLKQYHELHGVDDSTPIGHCNCIYVTPAAKMARIRSEVMGNKRACTISGINHGIGDLLARGGFPLAINVLSQYLCRGAQFETWLAKLADGRLSKEKLKSCVKDLSAYVKIYILPNPGRNSRG